ncbi:MAG: S-layer homology domain-containing protein [Firmicutes bacterium]|nr:S-layer homology domain-containing protein [Bacillota bacterium]
MKRVISFVLVLALVLGSFSMAFAAPADVAGTDYEEAVGALTELGVVTGYTDGNYYPEKAVNRAEAAKLVITALGLAEYAEGNTASFTDLAGYGWAAGYIGYAEALGILKGDGNGNFRPADTVSYQEMATMLVRAVGYTDESLPGTWPANYVVKAKALGIMDGIAQAGSAAANRGDVAVMIYNNLDNEIGTVDKDAKWNANEPKDTMLARLDQDLYNLTADTGANVTYIDPTTTGAGAAFVYDGTQSVADGVNLKAYLGAAVVAYANSDNEITGIKEVKSTFVSGTFDVVDGEVILTLADDTEYNLSTAKGMNTTASTTVGALTANTFENGAAGAITGVTAATSTVSAINDMTLAVKISGNYIKNVYSISNWDAAEIVQWDADLAEELAEDYTIAGNEFEMTQKDEIDTESFALVGVDSLDKIKENDVVTIYMASKVARVEVGTTVVTGTVTKATDTTYDADTKLTINGDTYKLVTGTIGEDNSDATLGAEGKFFLDYAGKIAYTDVVADSADNYAIVTLAAGPESGYDVDAYKVKMLTTAGESIYTLKKSENTTIAAVLTPANILVAYDLNDAGEVTTAVAITTTAATKYTSNGLMNGLRLAKDVVVYTYDAEGEWTVGAVADIPVAADLSGKDVDFYYNSTDEVIDVVILGPNAVEEDYTYGVIADYSVVKDGDDNVYEVVLYVDGAEKVVLTEDTLTSNIGATTLVKVDFSGATLTTITPVISTAAAVGSVEDEGIKVSGSAVYYDYTSGSAGEGTATDGTIVDVAEDVVVYLYDADDGFSVSKLSSIKKGNTVYMYQMDEEDVEIDIIVFSK